MQDAGSEDANPGERLVQELLWIHRILRSDLAIVRALAEEVLEGKDPESISSEIARLQTQSPLWQFKANCIYYCRLVHAHHGGEDALLFPALRRSGPAMEPVVDKLEADHRKISDILDEVEAVARDLRKDDVPANRNRVVDALKLLAEQLLAHLDYEERSISPTLRSWRSWPFL